MYSCRRFNLIESKETDVLRDLEIALRLTDDPACPQQPASLTNSETNSQNGLLQQSSLTSMASLAMASATATAPSSGHPSMLSADDSTTSLIDGDASIQPICTQPESGVPRSSASPVAGIGTLTNSNLIASTNLPGTPAHSGSGT